MSITVETRFRVTVNGTALDLDEAEATALMDHLADALLPRIGATPVQTRVHVLDAAPAPGASVPRLAAPEPQPDPVPTPEPESPPEHAGAPAGGPAIFADELVTGRYSEPEIAHLKEWIAAEIPLEEMARQLRRTKQSVYAKLGQVRFDMTRERIAEVADGWRAWDVHRLMDHLGQTHDPHRSADRLASKIGQPVDEVRAVIAHITGTPAPEPEPEPQPEPEPEPEPAPPPAPALKEGPDDWTHDETIALIRVLGDSRGGTFKQAVAETGHTMLSCDRRWRHLKQAGLMTVERYKASQESTLH